MVAPVQLLSAPMIRDLAAALGLEPTKRLGQNFVIDPNTIRRIVETSGTGADDTVLEIGPGLGSLTLGLLAVGARVVAVEIDPRLSARLPETVRLQAPGAIDRLTVVAADAMALTALPVAADSYRLVANLPYNISVPVLLHLLTTFPIAAGLVMVQREVAERLAAHPGSKAYGVPSVKLAWFGEARLEGAVGRNVFWPAPNVDSALLRFTAHGQRPGPERERVRVFAAIDAAFGARRKTLRQALSGWAGSPDAAAELCTVAGVDFRDRAERLVLDDFRRIAAAQEQR